MKVCRRERSYPKRVLPARRHLVADGDHLGFDAGVDRVSSISRRSRLPHQRPPSLLVDDRNRTPPFPWARQDVEEQGGHSRRCAGLRNAEPAHFWFSQLEKNRVPRESAVVPELGKDVAESPRRRESHGLSHRTERLPARVSRCRKETRRHERIALRLTCSIRSGDDLAAGPPKDSVWVRGP
jgi:hypothetical protein